MKQKAKKKSSKKKRGAKMDKIPKSKNPKKSIWGIPYSA